MKPQELTREQLVQLNEVLEIIRDCKEPLKNHKERDERDEKLKEIGKGFFYNIWAQIDPLFENEEDNNTLHWFYTKFVHIKKVGNGGYPLDDYKSRLGG